MQDFIEVVDENVADNGFGCRHAVFHVKQLPAVAPEQQMIVSAVGGGSGGNIVIADAPVAHKRCRFFVIGCAVVEMRMRGVLRENADRETVRRIRITDLPDVCCAVLVDVAAVQDFSCAEQLGHGFVVPGDLAVVVADENGHIDTGDEFQCDGAQYRRFRLIRCGGEFIGEEAADEPRQIDGGTVKKCGENPGTNGVGFGRRPHDNGKSEDGKNSPQLLQRVLDTAGTTEKVKTFP